MRGALRSLLVAAGAGLAAAGTFTGRSVVLHSPEGADVGEPLLLSDVLRTEGPKSARERSAVALPGLDGVQSFSGFLRTAEASDNQLFFWYFPPLNGDKDAPLAIWLQGGPGASSLLGLFDEMGAIKLSADLKPELRKVTWNHKYGLLFIDNPVGAGFSFTGSGHGYCRNSRGCVANNLLAMLQQFYQIFPETRRGGLYITGESYGGHYVPAFGARILRHNAKAPKHEHIPLRGVAVGDGWVDPVNMIPAYPELMRSLGLATDDEVRKIEVYCNKAVNFINAGKMLEAFNVWDEMLNGDVFPYHNYFHNITGSNNYDNFMMTNDPADFAYFGKYVNLPEVRKAIHVGNLTFGGNSGTCERHLLEDFHSSYRPELQRLLDAEGVRVLIYSGQLDVIIASSLTERFLPYLEWHGKQAFAAAPKKVWRVAETDAEVAGFVREVPKLQRVVVRGAGHIVPFDQPRRGLDMIERFIEGRSYHNLPEPKAAAALPVAV